MQAFKQKGCVMAEKQKKSEELKSWLAKSINPEQLAKYQKASIVSKTILDKKTGSVTLFAFDKGEGLSEHVSPFDALIFVTDGKAEIRIGGKPHQLKIGELIVMPAHVPHALKAIERFKMMLVMIRS
jgi:quercetin dioxygenase-like cupin family protein